MHIATPDSPKPRERGVSLSTNSVSLAPFSSNESIRVFMEGTGRDWRVLTGGGMMTAACYAADRGVRELFLPRVTASDGLIAGTQRFNSREVGVVLRDGVTADAVPLRQGSAVAIASADCPTLVMWSPSTGKAIVGHASRDSILRGLVGNMVRFLQPDKERRSDIMSFLILGIGPQNFMHRFDDPVYGEKNRTMVMRTAQAFGYACFPGPLELGCMDLRAVVSAQLDRLRVFESNFGTDGHDTFSDRLENGAYAWHSHRRGDKTRNLVMVHWA